MGPRCSSAETQVCHRSYIIAATTTPITSTAISPVKMSIGRKSLTNLHSEMIFLQGKPVFFISSYHLLVMGIGNIFKIDDRYINIDR